MAALYAQDATYGHFEGLVSRDRKVLHRGEIRTVVRSVLRGVHDFWAVVEVAV